MQPKHITPTTAFAIALLRKELAANKGKNVLVSPLSVSLALGMTANGAKGDTLDGFATALGLGSSDQPYNNKGYRGLLASLKRDGLGVQLAIANAIYARAGVNFIQAFLDENKKSFGANVESLDFSDPATVDAINAWVKANTGEKIDTIVKEINPDTIMILLNAVYFKGDWTTKFDKALTANHPFTTPGGAKDHPLMYRFGNFAHVDAGYFGDFESVSLPFGESETMRMIIMLPTEGKTVDDVVNALETNKLKQLIQLTYGGDGHLWLPRFEIDYDASLKDSLSALGMDAAFDSSRADLTGIYDGGRPFIQDVKHKTLCKVTEDGAEAAAVTSVEVGVECVPAAPFEMKVDRPFVVLIVDSGDASVLFAGVVNDPKNPA